MSRGVPVTSRRGVQAVTVAFAVALAVSAYFFATTGWGTPFRGCWPTVSPGAGATAATILTVFSASFLFAALRNPAGPSLEDPILIALVLGLFAAFAIGGGLLALSTGVVRYGQSGCLAFGTPWSYGAGFVSLVLGAFALLAAVAVGRDR